MEQDRRTSRSPAGTRLRQLQPSVELTSPPAPRAPFAHPPAPVHPQTAWAPQGQLQARDRGHNGAICHARRPPTAAASTWTLISGVGQESAKPCLLAGSHPECGQTSWGCRRCNPPPGERRQQGFQATPSCRSRGAASGASVLGAETGVHLPWRSEGSCPFPLPRPRDPALTSACLPGAGPACLPAPRTKPTFRKS